jgi:Sap, sulfolipid-1-addressing protein
MLFTILVMAVAVSLEPFRIGMTALMLNRPRPTLHLLAFLSGGFAMGLTVGLTVLFVFRRIVVGTPYFTLPKVQILLAAKALADRVGRGPGRIRSAIDRGRLVPWAQRLLDGRSVWLAGVAGLGIALPSVDYLAALAVILASGAAVMTQVGALLIFNVVAFALVEIPLVAYLLAPNATRAAMTALRDWIRARRRIEVVTLLAVVGCVLLAVGVTSL